MRIDSLPGGGLPTWTTPTCSAWNGYWFTSV